MAHTFAADFSAGNFHAAAVADNALITDAFVFTTVTFPVFLRSKDTFAEETFFFRFQSTIVDGFRFFYFSAGPRTNFFRRSKPDFHKFKIVNVQQGATLLNLYPDLVPEALP
ncbi:hypothetical protein D3C81_1826490 [compost metagenome]